jgi:hypothetical protein
VALLVAFGLLVAALVGCGSSGSSASSGGTASSPAANATADTGEPSAAYLAQVEAACTRSVAETEALTKRLPEFFAEAPNGNAAITRGVVGEGMKILAAEASRIRAAGPEPSGAPLSTFVGLFDPIVELAHQRLASGEAEDLNRSHELELLVTALSAEQAEAGEAAGLKSCSVDFTQALGGPE